MDPIEPVEKEEDFGELEVAEYIVFLLALDTYTRYVEETSGEDAVDDLIKKAIRLVRMADTKHLEGMRTFLDGSLPSATHKKMLDKAFRYVPTSNGLSRRSLQLRTLLSRGGSATMRAVFKTNRALQEIRAAMVAASMDDADAALDKFAIIKMRNPRLRDWIDDAAKTAGSGAPQNVVAAATPAAADEINNLLLTSVQAKGANPGSDADRAATDQHAEIISRVERDATETAQRAMKVSGEEDKPVTKSEAIGIATAAAAAAMGNSEIQGNLPQAFKGPPPLDPQQVAAATTDGRVLVAAGAGSGKTATLAARVAYLVQEKKVSPTKIFVVSFNKNAADEIRERVAQKVGKEIANQMSIGTMHSMFRGIVVQNGTPEEKAALTTNAIGTKKSVPQYRSQSPRTLTPGIINVAMAKMWKECFGEDPPKSPGNVVQAWQMNNITPERALEEALDATERAQAEWYQWTLGFKGIDKGWKPPCAGSNKDVAGMWSAYLAEWRDGGKARLGDFSDQILICRDILKRDAGARAKLQKVFDHILVDEAQDLNEVQHEIIDMMSQHITDGKDGKSLWIVGDEVQSINRFVGARPELFSQFNEKEGWETRSIATNYRCLPEIVEFANHLMDNHPRGIPMEAKPNEAFPRGEASIVVKNPKDHASGAIDVISNIKLELDAGEPLNHYAVLSRNRVELNDYETACIIEGIPYGRKTGSSFLKSPETITVMSYMNLAVGQDFERMQRSLAEVLDKPRRFFLPAGRSDSLVEEVINKRARRLGISSKQVNPLELFDDQGVDDFMNSLDPQRRFPSWKEEQAAEAFRALGDRLSGLRASVDAGSYKDRMGKEVRYTTDRLIGDILNMESVEKTADGTGVLSLRDTLMPQSSNDDDDEDPDADTGEKPIGNVAFLLQIAAATPDSPDTDPSDPRKFKAKLDDLARKSKDLRVDLAQWAVEQKALEPEKRSAPPCVILSTVHSVKGAQWDNTTVVMAAGVFPRAPKALTDEDKMTPEQLERLSKRREADYNTERQLAYVAMTRAKKNLTIVGPQVNAYGKDSGIGPFALQAGLKVGQNVPGKVDPIASVADESAPKTVLAHYNARTASQVDDYSYTPPGYDRRQS